MRRESGRRQRASAGGTSCCQAGLNGAEGAGGSPKGPGAHAHLGGRAARDDNARRTQEEGGRRQDWSWPLEA